MAIFGKYNQPQIHWRQKEGYPVSLGCGWSVHTWAEPFLKTLVGILAPPSIYSINLYSNWTSAMSGTVLDSVGTLINKSQFLPSRSLMVYGRFREVCKPLNLSSCSHLYTAAREAFKVLLFKVFQRFLYRTPSPLSTDPDDLALPGSSLSPMMTF